jgi:hypothetical protein
MRSQDESSWLKDTPSLLQPRPLPPPPPLNFQRPPPSLLQRHPRSPFSPLLSLPPPPSTMFPPPSSPPARPRYSSWSQDDTYDSYYSTSGTSPSYHDCPLLTRSVMSRHHRTLVEVPTCDAVANGQKKASQPRPILAARKPTPVIVTPVSESTLDPTCQPFAPAASKPTTIYPPQKSSSVATFLPPPPPPAGSLLPLPASPSDSQPPLPPQDDDDRPASIYTPSPEEYPPLAEPSACTPDWLARSAASSHPPPVEEEEEDDQDPLPTNLASLVPSMEEAEEAPLPSLLRSSRPPLLPTPTNFPPYGPTKINNLGEVTAKKTMIDNIYTENNFLGLKTRPPRMEVRPPPPIVGGPKLIHTNPGHGPLGSFRVPTGPPLARFPQSVAPPKQGPPLVGPNARDSHGPPLVGPNARDNQGFARTINPGPSAFYFPGGLMDPSPSLSGSFQDCNTRSVAAPSRSILRPGSFGGPASRSESLLGSAPRPDSFLRSMSQPTPRPVSSLVGSTPRPESLLGSTPRPESLLGSTPRPDSALASFPRPNSSLNGPRIQLDSLLGGSSYQAESYLGSLPPRPESLLGSSFSRPGSSLLDSFSRPDSPLCSPTSDHLQPLFPDHISDVSSLGLSDRPVKPPPGSSMVGVQSKNPDHPAPGAPNPPPPMLGPGSKPSIFSFPRPVPYARSDISLDSSDAFNNSTRLATSSLPGNLNGSFNTTSEGSSAANSRILPYEELLRQSQQYQSAGASPGAGMSPPSRSLLELVSDGPHMQEHAVPDEYRMSRMIGEKLPPINIRQEHTDLLFFLFYSYLGDALQLVAASLLFERGWRYHKQDCIWLARWPGVRPEVKTSQFEKGLYQYFDVSCWRRIPGWFKLSYSQLADKTMVPEDLKTMYTRYHTIYRNTIKMADRDPFLTDVGMTHELGTVDELRFLHCLL